MEKINLKREKDLAKLKEMRLAELEENSYSLLTKRFPLFERTNLAKGIKKVIKDRITGEYLSISELKRESKKIRHLTAILAKEIKKAKSKKELTEIKTSRDWIQTLALADEESISTKLTSYFTRLFS